MRPNLHACAAAMLLVSATTVACDRPGCDANVAPSSPLAPKITKVEYLQSLPNDPWSALLGVEFTGSDGSLADGSLLLYLGGDTDYAKRILLSDALAVSDVPRDAKSGRFGVVFPFNPGTVQDGDIVRLGAQLVDGSDTFPKGRRSNCYQIDLSFIVKPNAALPQAWERLRWLAAHGLDTLLGRS